MISPAAPSIGCVMACLGSHSTSFPDQFGIRRGISSIDLRGINQGHVTQVSADALWRQLSGQWFQDVAALALLSALFFTMAVWRLHTRLRPRDQCAVAGHGQDQAPSPQDVPEFTHLSDHDVARLQCPSRQGYPVQCMLRRFRDVASAKIAPRAPRPGAVMAPAAPDHATPACFARGGSTGQALCTVSLAP